MIREELDRIMSWQERHRLLIARLVLVLLATVLIDAVGTVLMKLLEAGSGDNRIHGWFDAFFFTTVQLLTVSSQLQNPLTTGGRIVDIVLEVWAVLVVAGSAGAIASFFQSADR